MKPTYPTVCLLLTLLVGTALATPVRVLLITGENNHNWRATTPVLRKHLEQAGRFALTITEAPAALSPDALDAYDVIVSHWNSWKKKDDEKLWSPELRAAYLDFIRNGKGHVVVHAGSSSFYDWADMQRVYGATWKLGTTGHGPVHAFPVRMTAQDHPVTRGLDTFRTTDELWHRPGLQPGVTVLAESFAARDKKGTGNWEPCLTLNPFGKGRCLTLLLGHDVAAMQNAGFVTLFTRSVEWAATGAVTVPAAPAGYTWQQDADDISLVLDGKPVWTFNVGKQDTRPHFDPLGLPGRPSLTWVSPPDHPWHYGLWHAWKIINGVNYWEENRQTRKPAGVTSWRNLKTDLRPDHSARLSLDLRYAPRGKEGAPVLDEQRTVTVSAPGEDGHYMLDWTMVFTARQDVMLDRTPLPGEPGGKGYGGYAGLSVRFAKDLTAWRAVSTSGAIDMDNHRRKAAGMDFSGLSAGEAVGVAILDHPANLNAPTPWYLAMSTAQPFAYFSPALICDGPYRMATGEQLTLRYRVIVHPGRWDQATLTAACEPFARE